MWYLIVLTFIFNEHMAQKWNVCNTTIDYFTGSNCWYNSDLYLETPQIIVKYGYPLKEYKVVTADGYVLTLFRIPREKCKGVVLIRNPAISSSVVFVDKGRIKSLAFLISDQGYDVWLSNSRGNHYSREHKYLNVSQPPFWNFSLNEMGLIDLPTEIRFVRNITKVKPGGISLIGYSMGTTVSLIYSSFFPEEAKRWINVMILMAPSAYLSHSQFLLKRLSSGINMIAKRAKEVNLYELFRYNQGKGSFSSLCNTAPTLFFCQIAALLPTGQLPFEISGDMLALVLSHHPDGISLNAMTHYAQLIRTGKFQLYDYGEELNLKKYQKKSPPLVPIQNITIPIYMLYGDKDQIVNRKDVEHLYAQLRDETKIYGKLIIKDVKHFSFVYGNNMVEKIYIPLIRMLNKIRGNNTFSCN